MSFFFWTLLQALNAIIQIDSRCLLNCQAPIYHEQLRYPETNITPAKKPKANRKFMSETRCSSCHMTTVMEWVSKQFRKYWCLGAASVKKPSVQPPKDDAGPLPFGWTDCFLQSYTPLENSRCSWNVRMIFFLSKAGSFFLGVHQA